MSVLDLTKECSHATRRKLSFKSAYRYWYALLCDRITSLFDWSGLPFEQHELEVRAQLHPQGYIGIVWSGKLGRWIVANGSGVGVTEYPDKWLTYVWACALDSGIATIGEDCCLLRNNSLLISSAPMVKFYATLLAHASLSLQAILINSRATGFSRVDDEPARDQVLKFYEALEEGRTEVVMSGLNLNALAGQKPIEFISDTITGRGDHVLDFWQALQNIYKDFLEMIGVSKSSDKRERLITSEVEQDIPVYRFNVEDMLDQRRLMAAELSLMMGSEVKVKLAESLLMSQNVEKEGAEDDNI